MISVCWKCIASLPLHESFKIVLKKVTYIHYIVIHPVQLTELAVFLNKKLSSYCAQLWNKSLRISESEMGTYDSIYIAGRTCTKSCFHVVIQHHCIVGSGHVRLFGLVFPLLPDPAFVWDAFSVSVVDNRTPPYHIYQQIMAWVLY